MMKSKLNLTYQKKEPNLDAADVSLKKPSHLEDGSLYAQFKDGFVKGDAYKRPKTFVVIFSGGTVREKDYFRPITSRTDLFPNLRFEFYTEDRFGQDDYPLVFSMAEAKVKEYRTSTTEDEPDRYFVLSDVDHFRKHLVAFAPICKEEGINLSVSNPCFEVWLYYSKKDDRFEGFVMPENEKEISKEVKSFLHNNAGGVNPRRAIFDIEKNIANARKNYEKDADGLPALFSTNVFVLAECLAPLIADGLKFLLEQRLATASMHKEVHEDSCE